MAWQNGRGRTRACSSPKSRGSSAIFVPGARLARYWRGLLLVGDAGNCHGRTPSRLQQQLSIWLDCSL